MDSNLVIHAILGIALLLGIAALRRLTVFEIQGMSMLMTGSARPGLYLYALIFLPGTVIHELSHWLMAEILQVPTGKLEVLPSLEKTTQGEERLGYVMTGRAGLMRSFLIGFAPLLVGLIILLILGHTLNTIWESGTWWQIGLTIYGLIVMSNSMIVSSADRRNWPIVAVLIAVVACALYYSGLTLPQTMYTLVTEIIAKVNLALGLTIGLNLAMILGLYGLRWAIERVTHKRIMRGR